MLNQLEVWFVTGSQHLYGEEVLKTVAEHATTGVKDKQGSIDIEIFPNPTYGSFNIVLIVRVATHLLASTPVLALVKNRRYRASRVYSVQK